MLRSAALFVCLIAVIVLVTGATNAGWPTLPFALFPAILLLCLLFERFIYKPIRSDRPGPGWERTPERFADPRSGRNVVVYYNPRSGERRYVVEPD
jgi:peptidoglycan/LPS O-acetylase OafA/YrhL